MPSMEILYGSNYYSFDGSEDARVAGWGKQLAVSFLLLLPVIASIELTQRG